MRGQIFMGGSRIDDGNQARYPFGFHGVQSAPIGAFELQAVVLGGIVAGSNHDSHRCARGGHPPGKGRGGEGRGAHHRHESLTSQAQSDFSREPLGQEASVEADDYRGGLPPDLVEVRSDAGSASPDAGEGEFFSDSPSPSVGAKPDDRSFNRETGGSTVTNGFIH